MRSSTLLFAILSPVALAFPFHFFRDEDVPTITTPYATPTPTGSPIATPTWSPIGSPTPTPSGYLTPFYPDTNLIYYHFDDAAGKTHYTYCEPHADVCPEGAEGCPFTCGAQLQDN